jgi:hypothetical protein
MEMAAFQATNSCEAGTVQNAYKCEVLKYISMYTLTTYFVRNEIRLFYPFFSVVRSFKVTHWGDG